MKRKLLFLAGLITMLPAASSMAAVSKLCISAGTVMSVSVDPGAGTNSWQMVVQKNDGVTLVTVKSEPQKSIDMDTAEGWSVYQMSLVAKLTAAPVDVRNTVNGDCQYFNQLITR